MKGKLKKFHVKKKNYKPQGITSLCWRFYCVNDNEVDLENTQIMCCILCYQNLIIGINPRIQARKD